MRTELLNFLKSETELELNMQKFGIPALSPYPEDPNCNMVDKDRVISHGQLMGSLLQPRHVAFPDHTHNYVELVYMYSGTTTHVINKKTTIKLETYDLLLLKQGVSHSISPAGHDDIAIHFVILPEFFKHSSLFLEDGSALRHFIAGSMKESNSIADYLHFHLKNLMPAQNLLENMIWSLMNGKRNRQAINQATMGILIQELLLHSDNKELYDVNQYEVHLLLSAYQYIETCYAEATLEEFSLSMKQPSYYISRLFKKHTGSTFKEYIQTTRLSRAVYLLTATKKPVERIIEEIGYENSSYFHKLFKKAYHMTPKQYRDFHKQL